MRKYAYLNRLEELLAELPPKERLQVLQRYREAFDAAGVEREEETSARLGTPEEAAVQILHGETEPPPRLAGRSHKILLAAIALAVLLLLVAGIGLLGRGQPMAAVSSTQAETAL